MDNLHSVSRMISISLLLITGISAIIAGLLFVTDPTGKLMGMSPSYLSHSPFSNYLIPGIILLLVNGFLNIIAAVSSIKKYRFFPILILIQGLLLSGWIIVQVIMVRDFNGLHFMMLFIGIILIVFGIILKGQYKWSDFDIGYISNKVSNQTLKETEK
ncbi:MAG: hypothetical protein IPM42_17740 [Saprospiraceae bacterium]|nr:hypothetical protein [Saprospiraceae bacterium]